MASSLWSTSVHHCEVVRDEPHGANSNYDNCKINPGHKNFLTVAEFGMEHLPTKQRRKRNMDRIKDLIDSTVKITVSYTSKNRPDTFPGCNMPYPLIEHRGSNFGSRCGTGFINKSPFRDIINGPCPCPQCKKSNHPEMTYWKFLVLTATHVVFDNEEAQSVVVDLFYDTEDKHGVEHLYGVGVRGTYDERYQTDACDVVCVTHDKELGRRLKTLDDNSIPLDNLGFGNPSILISHPHGASKKISLGNFHERRFITELDDSLIKLKRGTIISFQSIHDQQEHTQRIELGYLRGNCPSNDTPRHTTITPTFNTPDGKNPEINNTVKYEENTTLKSGLGFYDLLTPTENPNDFYLNIDMEAGLPENSQIAATTNLFGFVRGCYTFPRDTKFTSSIDDSIVDIPRGTKFYCSKFPTSSSYVTYDMPSCPGSSGAVIAHTSYWYSRNNNPFRHFGSCGNGSKNRSGLNFKHLRDDSVNDFTDSES